MEEENKEKKKAFSLRSLLSGMVGGVITFAILIALVMSQVIPLPLQAGEQTSDRGTNVYAESVKHSALTNDDVPENLTELSKSIVGIINLQQTDVWNPNEEAGSGSGIIYKVSDDVSYIVTNNHVIQDAHAVEIVLHDGKRVNAEVVGADALTDLAVLKVDQDLGTKIAPFGQSGDLTVGETVVAIGNPLGMDFAGSVTRGIVSGLNRSVSTQNGKEQWLTEVIQTDAAINPGNSGGALVNQKGEIIGINTMKIASETVEGIGLAIPIDEALPIIEQLEKNGEVERPYLGVYTVNPSEVPAEYEHHIQSVDQNQDGIVIAQVEPGSPAEQAGLKQFDVITEVDGEKLSDKADLKQFLYKNKAVNDEITITFIREGKEKNITLTLSDK